MNAQAQPLRKFPSHKPLTFMAIQVLTGLAISQVPFGSYGVICEFFEPFDRTLPAFRTMFFGMRDPVAGKVFLLIWWTIFIPWGLLWIARFTNGLKPVNPAAFKNRTAAAWSFLLGVLITAGLAYANTFSDYSGAQVHDVPSRADIIPWVLESGMLTISIWLAMVSFLMLTTFYLSIASIRALVSDAIPHGD
jgi:hypothetical protein